MNRNCFLEQARSICESVIDGEWDATSYKYNLFLNEANEIEWDCNGNVAEFGSLLLRKHEKLIIGYFVIDILFVLCYTLLKNSFNCKTLPFYIDKY